MSYLSAKLNPDFTPKSVAADINRYAAARGVVRNRAFTLAAGLCSKVLSPIAAVDFVNKTLAGTAGGRDSDGWKYFIDSVRKGGRDLGYSIKWTKNSAQYLTVTLTVIPAATPAETAAATPAATPADGGRSLTELVGNFISQLSANGHGVNAAVDMLVFQHIDQSARASLAAAILAAETAAATPAETAAA